MIKLTKNGYETNYDIDSMLYEDAVWLSRQIKKPTKDFTDTAQEMDLRQEDWDTFWKRVRGIRRVMKKEEERFTVVMHGKDYRMTKEEMELATYYLGEPEEVSNCCGEKIKGQDICSDCLEHCAIIYVYE